jgi:membrane protease YdiL (CAAX protease family)
LGAKKSGRGDGAGLARPVSIFLLIFAVLLLILSIPWAYLYSTGAMSYSGLEYDSAASLSMSFSLSVLYYFLLYKRLKPVRIPSMLGLGKGSIRISNVLLGFLILAILLTLEVIVAVASYATGVHISSNVAAIFGSAPAWFLVFSAIIAPINEEVFFRGFLVPRVGILASAAIFGLAHFTYNSTFGIEVIAAFVFGLISGYVYKKTNSLYPSIIAHILLNSISLLILFSVVV